MKLLHAAENGASLDGGTKRLGFSDSLATSLAAAIVAAVVPILPFTVDWSAVTILVITVVAALIWLAFGLVTLARYGWKALWFLVGAPLALWYPYVLLVIRLYGGKPLWDSPN
jgi:VIT1/CCC1 family predicted Fe2+/Mn2+ transporter